MTAKTSHMAGFFILGPAQTARLGIDIVTTLTRKPFYITSSRYRSMVTDYVTPMDKTYTLLGQPKISLAQGVQETADWLRTQREYSTAT